MKKFNVLLLLTAMLAGTVSAQTDMHSSSGAMSSMGRKQMPVAASAGMAEGEIRKIDMDAKKITIKHGEIKSMDMPGMTMMFQVKDPALLVKAKVGEKIRFKAEKIGGAIVVTDIQPVD